MPIIVVPDDSANVGSDILVAWLSERKPSLLRFFRRGMPAHQADQAEDLYQDVCRSALAAWQGYCHHSVAGFRAWLRRIAANRMRDWWKARRRAQRWQAAEAIGGDGPWLDGVPDAVRTPSSLARADEIGELVKQALLVALNEEERLAVRLRYAEAKPWAEVAERLGRDVASARRLCLRALTRLAARIPPGAAG